MITDLQFWKRALSLSDITTCKSFPEGDLLAWNADDYVPYNSSLPYQYEVVEIESEEDDVISDVREICDNTLVIIC